MALLSITEHECCSYGFDKELENAEKLVQRYYGKPIEQIELYK